MNPPDRARAARAIDEFLRALGHEPTSSDDLRETGQRVADAWLDELLEGQSIDAEALLRAESFVCVPGAGVVVLRDVEVSTVCPHHLMPALGTALIAYAPGERVAGLGTLTRALHAVSRRLTLQERIGEDLVALLMGALGARGAACLLKLRHGCLTARGPRSGAWVETIATAGAMAPGGDLHPLLLSWRLAPPPAPPRACGEGRQSRSAAHRTPRRDAQEATSRRDAQEATSRRDAQEAASRRDAQETASRRDAQEAAHAATLRKQPHVATHRKQPQRETDPLVIVSPHAATLGAQPHRARWRRASRSLTPRRTGRSFSLQ